MNEKVRQRTCCDTRELTRHEPGCLGGEAPSDVIKQLTAERDRARDLAAHLEEELAQMETSARIGYALYKSAEEDVTRLEGTQS